MRASPFDVFSLPRGELHPSRQSASEAEELVFVLEAGIAVGLFMMEGFLAVEAAGSRTPADIRSPQSFELKPTTHFCPSFFFSSSFFSSEWICISTA
jgi:hypothetical protein